MRKRIVCLLVLIGFAVNVQTVRADISGKVTDKDGKAVANAVCSLLAFGTSGTSGADGAYTIVAKDSTGTIISGAKLKSQSITLNKNFLDFRITKPTSVKIEIFDVKGNLLQKEVMKSVQSGVYRFNIGATAHSTKLLVIRAAVGKDVKSFRYLPLKNGLIANNSSLENSSLSNGTLAKIAAVNDTMLVKAPGYTDKKVAVTTYDTTGLDVTLEVKVANTPTVNLDQEKQPFHGFGINATIMQGSLNWDQLFKNEGNNALGLSVLRIGMNEYGKMRDVPNDWKSVRTANPDVKVIGSCWSAEAGWKSNNNVQAGGYLKTDYYSQWAERIAKFASENDLYAMSIANESDFASSTSEGPKPLTNAYPSMTYTGKQMAAFVKEARKAFDQYAPDVKMIAPEASLWIHVWSNLSCDGTVLPGAPEGGFHSSDPHKCGCFSNDINDEAALAKCAEKCNNGDGYDYGHWLWKDQEAWKAFDIMGVHQYESQVAYPWPADVNGGVRDKEVWQTEMSGVMYWPEQGPSTHIENGVAVARWIQSALTIGEASVWCYWWYEAYYSNDNEGLAITQPEPNKIAKRYYTFGNYSKYIRPGHTIVNITGTEKLPEKVLLTASKDKDGKVVIVAVNENTTEQAVEIAISGGTAPSTFTPVVTDKDANWKEGSDISVGTDGVLKATLGKMSVTTFVSK